MIRTFGSLILCAMCLAQTAKAHPHVFLDARTGFIFGEHGYLKALRMSWTHDQFATLIPFEALDLDGHLGATVRADIVASKPNWAAHYKGDVHLEIVGQARQFGRPEMRGPD